MGAIIKYKCKKCGEVFEAYVGVGKMYLNVKETEPYERALLEIFQGHYGIGPVNFIKQNDNVIIRVEYKEDVLLKHHTKIIVLKTEGDDCGGAFEYVLLANMGEEVNNCFSTFSRYCFVSDLLNGSYTVHEKTCHSLYDEIVQKILHDNNALTLDEIDDEFIKQNREIIGYLKDDYIDILLNHDDDFYAEISSEIKEFLKRFNVIALTKGDIDEIISKQNSDAIELLKNEIDYIEHGYEPRCPKCACTDDLVFIEKIGLWD